MHEHYFDWAATSPTDIDILKEAVELTGECWANPSSTHEEGKKARKLLESARKRAAEALQVSPENIYFTSGGTESDQIPLLSLMTKPHSGQDERTVLISSIEHPAIREQALAMKHCGWNIVSIPADKRGIITSESVVKLLTPKTMMVCVMAVNNETGSIQPVYEIADAITKWAEGKRKPKFHVDCVQAIGKIPVNLNHPGIDSAALSSHKICGPRGTGILYLKDKIDPFLRGGGQENGIRSGTENVMGAVAFSKCLERYVINEKNQSAVNKFNEQKKLTANFIKELSSLKGACVIPECRNDLQNEEFFSPYVVQASFSHIPGNVMLRALDSKGFSISTGSACSSKKNSRPVLEAMGVSSEKRETSVRFSFGPHTTEKAMIELFETVKEINSLFNK